MAGLANGPFAARWMLTHFETKMQRSIGCGVIRETIGIMKMWQRDPDSVPCDLASIIERAGDVTPEKIGD